MSSADQRVEQLLAELTELRRRMESVERRQVATRRRLRATVPWLAAAAVVLGGAAALAQATCSQPLAGLGLVSFCANSPAVAADVNANTTALVNLIQAKVGTLATGATSSQTVTAAKLNVGSGVNSSSHITGGNSVGNIHVDGTGNGGVYLNWYSGKFTVFGSGTQGEVGRIDNAGNMTISGTLNGHRPIAVVSNSCAGANSSCSATCSSGVIKTAWGFHGGNGSNSDFGFVTGTCGSFTQWKGSCIGQTSCTVTTGCNSSSIILECW